MNNSKLITYLRTLSNYEMRDFGQFIVYKTAKGPNDLNVLFNYLKKLHPIFPEKKIEKKFVSKKIFKEEKSTKRIINTMYKLGLILDEYLVMDVLKEREKEKDFLLLNALQKRKLNKFFFKKAKQIQEDWQGNPRAGIDQLYDEFKLNEMCMSHPYYSLVKEMPINPEVLLNQIDKHYFAIKLYWNLCSSNTSNYIVNSKNGNSFTELFLDEIIDLTNNNDEYATTHGKLLSQMVLDFKNREYPNYYKYKNEFFQHFRLFNQKEKNDILTLLFHACYENYKKGEADAQNELFELSCFVVDNDLLMVDGYIFTGRFWNIVHIGLSSGELDWTDKVIEEYGEYLEEEIREDIITICKALLAFNRKKYSDALQLLSTVKFQNPVYGLYSKSVQLQCYYELGDEYDDLFRNLSKSFYLYITRKHTFSESMKNSFCNFISLATQLQNAKYDPNKNFDGIFKKINTTENLAYKSWLKEKVKIVSNY